ncbi:BA75_00873T0 [Komagataella pastoris]|uniref:BA75_00873T0 n=1 Tax=Komagataella pastoris TaxID=4922 RepID=A0A1B2J8A9_PICPA|nr:BA75_00873T0 [Komagataella pastoris]
MSLQEPSSSSKHLEDSSLSRESQSPEEYGSSTSKSTMDYEPQASPVQYDAGLQDEVDCDVLSKIESDVNLSRELSRKLTNAYAVEQDTDKSAPLLPMGNGRPYPPPAPDREQYIVAFDGPNDPLFPQNWPTGKKIRMCLLIGLNAFCVAFGSAVFSPAIPYISAQYGVINVVSTLSVSLFVIGFATGPVVWAPLSELYGRKPVLFVSSLGFMLFSFAVATAQDIQTIMICRFFTGAIGSGPMVVVPAGFADMFGSGSRGIAITIFGMTIFCGPLLAPIIGAFIAKSYLGWRWIEYILGMLGAAGFVSVFFYEETHHPIILVNKAVTLRRRTGNWMIQAPHEEVTLSIKEICEKNITRPLKMLFTEPILLLISIYTAFIYGILYLFLTAYPLVFNKGYHMTEGVAELPYFGLIIGQLLGGAFLIWYEISYNRKIERLGIKRTPEARLVPSIVGGIAFPIGLLWFCWSGHYAHKVHWIVPTLSGLFSGFGLITIFNQCLNYLVDAYLVFAASAMAANTFLRSSFGACFPLFAGYMFEAMGINWAGLLIGLFAASLIPLPIIFYFYGERIRHKSKYAFVY